MKSLKTLVCVSSFVLCFGAASMASAASIQFVGGGTSGAFTTPGGAITISTPSSFGAPITCKINFGGTVNSNGTATITTMTPEAGGSPLCGLPKLKGTWTLTPTSTSAVEVTNVGFTVASFPATNCGPSLVNTTWASGGLSLTTTPQTLSGGCSVSVLNVTPTPALTIVP